MNLSFLFYFFLCQEMPAINRQRLIDPFARTCGRDSVTGAGQSIENTTLKPPRKSTNERHGLSSLRS